MASKKNINDYGDVPMDLTTPKPNIKRRSSFFNIVAEEEDNKSIKKGEYIAKLKNEKLEWHQIFKENLDRAREMRKKFEQNPSNESKTMTQEQLAYLDQGIDVREYLKQTDNFSNTVLRYVKKKEMLQKQLHFCQQQLNDKLIESTIKNLGKI